MEVYMVTWSQSVTSILSYLARKTLGPIIIQVDTNKYWKQAQVSVPIDHHFDATFAIQSQCSEEIIRSMSKNQLSSNRKPQIKVTARCLSFWVCRPTRFGGGLKSRLAKRVANILASSLLSSEYFSNSRKNDIKYRNTFL